MWEVTFLIKILFSALSLSDNFCSIILAFLVIADNLDVRVELEIGLLTADAILLPVFRFLLGELLRNSVDYLIETFSSLKLSGF